MTVGHCTQKLLHVVLCLIFSNDLILYDSLEKFSSTAIFHDDVNENFFNVNFMNPDDVRMVLKLI
jgi:hypothetical protein